MSDDPHPAALAVVMLVIGLSIGLLGYAMEHGTYWHWKDGYIGYERVYVPASRIPSGEKFAAQHNDNELKYWK